MKGSHLLSTLQIHITELFRPSLRQSSLSTLMNGLFELQVKDEIYVATPTTPGLIITQRGSQIHREVQTARAPSAQTKKCGVSRRRLACVLTSGDMPAITET